MASKKKAKARPAPKKAAARPVTSLRDPRSGLFVKKTVTNARRIEAAIRKMAKVERATRSKLFRKAAKGAKRVETREKIAKAYKKASKRADVATKKLVSAKAQLERLLAAQKPRAPRLPVEMEFGVAYVASRRDRASDVNFNIRLRRHDGRGMTKEESVRAIERIAENGVEHIERTYEVTSVEWSRPNRGSRSGVRWSRGVRSGDESDVEAFRPILMEVLFGRRGEGLRMGAVRQEDAWLRD